MTLIAPSEECLAVVLKEYDTTLTRVKADVQILREWLRQQPHLPQTINDTALQNILVRCKSSVERTKQTLDMHYTLKTALPEFFSDRDPLGAEIRFVLQNTIIAPLPRTTSDGYRVVILKTLVKDAKEFDAELLFKAVLMVGDLRLLEDSSIGDIMIYDFEFFGMGHIAKMTLPLLKKIEICGAKGYRARLKGVHFIKTPPMIDILYNLSKRVLKTKLAARHHVHMNLESLYQHVDRDVLPLEYGGNEKSLTVLHDEWQKRIVSERDWFLDQERNGKTNETLRPGKCFNTSDLFGFEGTFKQLAVD